AATLCADACALVSPTGSTPCRRGKSGSASPATHVARLPRRMLVRFRARRGQYLPAARQPAGHAGPDAAGADSRLDLSLSKGRHAVSAAVSPAGLLVRAGGG